MPPTSEEKRLDLSPEAILSVLKDISNPSLIGESPLAKTAVIDRILPQMDLKDSAPNRGLVLAMIVRDVIVNQQERTEGTEESVPWDFLALRYLAGRSLVSVSIKLSIGRRSLARIQQRALGQLASALLPIVAPKPNYES